MFSWISIYIILTVYTDGFNIDAPSRLVHRYETDTKFGYSVDMYSDRNAHWVLVGAPRAQTGQPGVTRGGAVFKCSTVGQACYEIIFDQRGASTALNGSISLPIDSKSDQWFGATISASRKSDIIVACAPYYTFFYSTFDKKEPVGVCFTARDDLSPETVREYSPCRGSRWGYHRLGFCMAGFSAAIGQDGDTLFMGAPGAFYWQGVLATQNLENIDYDDSLITREGPAHLDDQYLGYAVASGELDGNDGSEVAVGVPKGNGLLGMVAIYNTNNQNLKNISGEQVGSYFGAALAVSDLDSDGLDDILVGAPLFTHQLVVRGGVRDQEWSNSAGLSGTTKQTGGYEAGKVYIFWQRTHGQFYQEDFTAIIGRKDWARFGHALAAVGDLNGDGLNDFIVGAPYDGSDGNGAVHIFNGNSQRRFDKPSQVIYGKDIGDNVKTFGFSVAGGVDVDGNDYPDVVVGAYASDRAVLMRTRPVVSISGTVSLSPDVVDLGQSAEARSLLTICMNYSGKGAPDSLSVRLEIDLDADHSPENRRAYFMLTSGARYIIPAVNLERGRRDCSQQHHIMVPDTIRDKLSPILVNVSYFVSEQDRGSFSGQLAPIKNALLPPSWSVQLQIANDCGPNQHCIPDLQMSVESSKPSLSRGVSERVNLTVVIFNAAMDAHQAKFYVISPRGTRWVGTFAEEFTNRVHCTPPNSTNSDGPTGSHRPGGRLECDIGNPFRHGHTLRMQVEYETNNVPADTKELVFKLEVNSTLPDDPYTRQDNKVEVRVPLESNIRIRINSIANPDHHPFYKEDDRSAGVDLNGLTDRSLVGPDVSHVYSVLNDASSATKITSAKLDIFFPHLTQTNDFLLYVLYDIHTEGNVKCRPIQAHNINPLNWVLPPQHLVQAQSGPARVGSPPRRPPGRRRERRVVGEDEEDPELGVGGDVAQDNDRSSLSKAFLSFVREVKEGVKELMASWSTVKELTMDCSQMHCIQWTCEITDLEPQQAATVMVNSTLFLRTILKEGVPKATISSLAVVEVTRVPYQPPKGEKLPIEAKTATTVVQRLSRDYVGRGVPSWMIIVAILTGITLLILMILLFWRLGFFKRKRPPRAKAKLQHSEANEGRGQYSTYTPATQEYGTAYGHGHLHGNHI